VGVVVTENLNEDGLDLVDGEKASRTSLVAVAAGTPKGQVSTEGPVTDFPRPSYLVGQGSQCLLSQPGSLRGLANRNPLKASEAGFPASALCSGLKVAVEIELLVDCQLNTTPTGVRLIGTGLIWNPPQRLGAVLPTGRTKSLAWAGLVGLVGRALMPNVV
jgi:hypothetical protein